MTGRDWRSQAACRDVDPELFFPVAEVGALAEQQIEQAKAVCAGCPVRAECLVFALSHLAEGVAGGLTPAERRSLGRRRPASAPARRPAAKRPSSAAAGRAAIRAGGGVHEVARQFGVTVRTAERWAAQVRAAQSRGVV